ncbi:MAG: OsmC family protein [bacterium JZ-2024 1]
MVNNINLKLIEKTREEVVRGEFPERKEFVVEGRWLYGEEGQFEAVVEFPGGNLRMVTDQPPATGGRGQAPNAIQYCVFAMVACFATTYMTLAAQRGVEITSLKARGASVVNMKSVLELEQEKPVEKVWVELAVESSASREQLEEIRKEAQVKCPAAYTVQNSVPFESRLI